MRLVIALFVMLAFIELALAGCSDPCAQHGGIKSQGGGWTYCNDGTQIAGYG
jgi:hypothetical protein